MAEGHNVFVSVWFDKSPISKLAHKTLLSGDLPLEATRCPVSSCRAVQP